MGLHCSSEDDIVVMEDKEEVIDLLHYALLERKEDSWDKEYHCDVLVFCNDIIQTSDWFYSKVSHIPNSVSKLKSKEIFIPSSAYETPIRVIFQDVKTLENGEARERFLLGLQLSAIVVLGDVSINDNCDYLMFTRMRFLPHKVYTLAENLKTIESLQNVFVKYPAK